MRAHPVTVVLCERCHGELPAGQRVCPRCGPARPAWVDQPWAILGVLFLGFGPLALPWLWKSRAFNRPAKLALALAVTAWTALILYLLWWSLAALLKALTPLVDELRAGW